jgi:cytosine/adenosine deaminase-related metal-dependent hydrolase
VNVLPMDQLRVLPHQTVLVQGDAIARIGPINEVAIPEDTQRIDGNGSAYLLPGLADMHVHVAEPDDAALYVVNGVTTVLHMGGPPVGGIGKIKQIVESGSILAPRTFFAFRLDNEFGFVADTPERARNAVDLAQANGYDFIKVYNNLSPPVFAAIVSAAREHGMAVVGHGVRSVGLPKALFEGQVMVAHAEEFYYTAFGNRTDVKLIPTIVAQTRRSGAYVTPNLSAFEAITKQWGHPEQVAEYLRDVRAQFMTPAVRTHWINKDYVKRQGDLTAVLAFLREFTKALQDGGVPLLTGTDSPDIPGVFPGYSIHDDLRTLLESGLSPFQALSAATRTPGEFISKTIPHAQRFGIVSEGYRADLVLARGNPLQDLQVLKSPLGVMRAGRWLPSAELSGLVEAQKSKYQ